MKRIITVSLSVILVFSMAFTAMAAKQDPKKAPASGSFSLEDLFGLFGSFSEEESSEIKDAISDALDSVKEALPEILSSVEEFLPGMISSIQEALPEDADLEDKEDLQNALDQISGIVGSGSAIAAGDDSISGIVGSDELNTEDADKISGIAGAVEEDADASLNDLIGSLSGIAGLAADDTQDTGSIVGGWTVNRDADILLTEEEAEIFQKAETTLAGGAYTPVAVLATQLVAGTNYAYLCLGAPDDPEKDVASWYIVTLYKDLSGNVTTLSIEDLELDDLETTNSAYNPAFVGSWIPNHEAEAPAELPQDAQNAFDQALEGYVGVAYSPIALLGTQLVSGTNYKILCYGTLVTKDPVTSWYILDVYETLQGDCSITNAQLLDLTDYIDYGDLD